MSDSEPKDKPQVGKENPPGTHIILVRNPNGTMREQPVDEKNRFLRKPKPLVPTVEFVRARRKRLYSIRKDTGRFDGMTESMAILEELLEIVHMPIETDSKTGLPDSKHMSAKVQAAELIHLITEGKPSPSEQEMDKLQTQPVRVIMVNAPDGVKPMEERPKEKLQPSWAEVTEVRTNPKTGSDSDAKKENS
jgi:hypothetical protein